MANASRVGNDLAARLRQMESERERWTDGQMEEVSKRVDRTRKEVAAMFDDWLPRQSCISLERVDSFRDSMVKYAGGNLKALGLDKLAEKIERRALEIIRDMQERQKAFYSVDAARAYLAGRGLSPKTPVSDLARWPEEIDKLKKELEKARRIREVPEIEDCLRRLDRLRKDCVRQEKRNWELHGELIGSSFLTMAEIEGVDRRIAEAIDIFVGQDPEFEDLKKLWSRLKMFRDDFSFFEDLNVSNEELEKRVAAIIGEVEEEDEGEELAGEWRSPSEIYGAMLETLREKRRKRSGQWTGAMVPSLEKISEADAGECMKMLSETEILPFYVVAEDAKKAESGRREIRNRLSELWFSEAGKGPDEIAQTGLVQCQELLSGTEADPDCATEEHRRRVVEMRSALMERLDKYKVAGLVARFRQLSPDMQEQFLKIAVKEFKRSREAVV